MKAISIYTITRNQNTEYLQKLERQLSGRDVFLKIREWELDSMKALVSELERHMQAVYALRFFYSFQIPRLGKEFDLLQIKEEQILNLELKSGQVSDEAIRKQLIQNRYYLAALGKPIRSYTYISSQNRLVRLTNHDRIVEADWEQLCADLRDGGKDYEGDVEELFQAELYLISPLTEPERFLNKEYFLTAQQRDIERQILKKIRAERTGAYWFTGLPGTGKTLLLYDIAMKLSGKQRVCMIHCGTSGEEWKKLHERLRRILWMSDREITEETGFEDYGAVFVDEVHLLSEEPLKQIIRAAGTRPVIFSSDCEDQLSPEEADRSAKNELEKLPGIQLFRLTNRIRTNVELSSFIQNLMHLPDRKTTRHFPNVTVLYANDEREAENLMLDAGEHGFQILSRQEDNGKTMDRLAVLLDEKYYYDENRYLRSQDHTVRTLFYRLNGAKEKLMIVVKENAPVYERVLELL